MVGVILMVAGVVGLVVSFSMTIWADRTRGRAVDRGVVREREVVDRDVY